MSSPVDACIVVIAYDEEAVIVGCLEALRGQRTARSYEILVVDDGSTDRTAALVAAVARDDPRVQLISHDRNRGRGAARRTGQVATLAPLVGYVDADVIVPPDWLEQCAMALDGRGAVSGVATPDGDCVVLARLLHPEPRVRRHTMAISGGNALFDATVLRAVGFDERDRLGEDFRLARRLTVLGYPIATVPGLVVEHRETKSYPASFRWMWQNGLDASRLPIEFAVVRVPDLTWLGWLAALATLVALAGTGSITWMAVVAGAVGCTAVVAVGHTASRFRLRPRTVRWLATCVLDVPLVAAYLAGRTCGLPAALVTTRRWRPRPAVMASASSSSER